MENKEMDKKRAEMAKAIYAIVANPNLSAPVKTTAGEIDTWLTTQAWTEAAGAADLAKNYRTELAARLAVEDAAVDKAAAEKVAKPAVAAPAAAAEKTATDKATAKQTAAEKTAAAKLADEKRVAAERAAAEKTVKEPPPDWRTNH